MSGVSACSMFLSVLWVLRVSGGIIVYKGRDTKKFEYLSVSDTWALSPSDPLAFGL